jgi:hypothetical protein
MAKEYGIKVSFKKTSPNAQARTATEWYSSESQRERAFEQAKRLATVKKVKRVERGKD